MCRDWDPEETWDREDFRRQLERSAKDVERLSKSNAELVAWNKRARAVLVDVVSIGLKAREFSAAENFPQILNDMGFLGNRAHEARAAPEPKPSEVELFEDIRKMREAIIEFGRALAPKPATKRRCTYCPNLVDYPAEACPACREQYRWKERK
jgi:predicted Zn-ribbon and HTH transcriptional regulator